MAPRGLSNIQFNNVYHVPEGARLQLLAERLGNKPNVPFAGVVIAAVLSVVLLSASIFLCGHRKKTNKVQPSSDAEAAGGGPQPVPQGSPGPPQPAVNNLVNPHPMAAAPALAPPPPPPWTTNPSDLPKGFVMLDTAPPSFKPLASNPRLPTDPPYERLVLISSRVKDADHVARACLPHVAYIVYDWKNFTLQELLRYIKKVLGAQKVVSLAVVAPGSTPGTIGLLEGANTTPEKLATKTELSQFWRVLSGCVALSGLQDGRRIDLVGCRLVEAPREAALLLKELWTLTTVPFAAADALLGYMLTTFMEEPTTGQLALISSTIPGLDLYFNKYTLLGIPPPANLPVAMAPVASAAPPLPPGSPPHAPAPTQPPAPMPVSHSPAEAGHDIFAKFISALQASGRTPDAAFAAADVNRDGRLSSAELAAAVMGMVPGASEIDRKHFQVLLDTDYEDGMVTQSEFVSGLALNSLLQSRVRARDDPDEVLMRFRDYLSQNSDMLRDVYKEFDANNSGFLDHTELQQLVAAIPNLEPAERKYVLVYLYQNDANMDGRLSFDELQAAVAKFAPASAPVVMAPAAQSAPQSLPQQLPAPVHAPGPSHAMSGPPPQLQAAATAAAGQQFPAAGVAAATPLTQPAGQVPPPQQQQAPLALWTPGQAAAGPQTAASTPLQQAAPVQASLQPPGQGPQSAALSAAPPPPAEATPAAAPHSQTASAFQALGPTHAAVPQYQVPASTPVAAPVQASLAPLAPLHVGPLPSLGGSDPMRRAPLAPLGGGAPLPRPGGLAPL